MNEPDDRLDAALRRAFTPPPARAFAELASRTTRAAPSPRPWRAWRWLLAAAAALVVAALWLQAPSDRQDGAALGRLWLTAYENAQSQGFTRNCCEPVFDLATTCRDRFAATLGLAADAQVELIGCFCSVPAGEGMVLLARQAGEACCVYVLRKEHDPGVTLPASTQLRLARRELGELVLYGLGAEATDATLAQFVLPAN
jgi:hypothetical protein